MLRLRSLPRPTRLLSALSASLFATLTLGLSAPSAQAQAGRFDGGGAVYNFNQTCRNFGWTFVPERVTVRYHPPNVGTNGNNESLAFYTNAWGQGYVRYGGPIGTDFVAVDTGGVFRTPFYSPASDNRTSVRITQRSPATISASTSVPVRLRGRIRGWGNIEGCVADFEVTVFQRE